MNLGKYLRFKQFYQHDKNHTVIIPMDHGMTRGPIQGLDNMQELLLELSNHNVDGLILHKGMISHYADILAKIEIPLMMHLSARTILSSSNKEVLVGSVTEALSYGCSAVSVHINFGEEEEGEMLRDVAHVSGECYRLGMPLLIMAYSETYNVSIAKHLARISTELGADWVKLAYTEEGGEFREVTETCKIPVLISGGEKVENLTELETVLQKALEAKIGGISIGRNIFQSENVSETISRILELVRNDRYRK